MKPLLFLDIDGVLSVFGGEDVARVGSLTVAMPEGTVQRVKALIEVFEPMWATTWREGANDWHTVLEVGDELPWPVLPFGLPGTPEFKLESIVKVAEGYECFHGRPCRWAFFDDDLDWELRMMRLTRADFAPNLLRQIGKPGGGERYGLGDDDVRVALEWARRYGN